MSSSYYRIPQIEAPVIPGGALFPGTSRDPITIVPDYNPSFLKFDLQTGKFYTETAKETIDKSNEALKDLNPVNALTGFLTEHQTDYVVGGIGLVLIIAGVFALVQSAKPI